MKSKALKQILILICLSYVFFILGNSMLSLTNPDEKVKDFLKKHLVTYCVVSKSSFSYMERTAASLEFKLGLLKTIGDEYIVRIQRV